MRDASIPTRYPSEFKKIYKEFTPERATLAIVKSKEVIAWIKIEFAK